MTLSKRLQSIVSLVTPGETAADIGTDHGFVPVFLVKEGVVRRAIASDVRKEPLLRAEAHVREAELSDKIECRLGDGLSVLSPGEADRIILSGMGGPLMIRLLSERPEILSASPELVLSPHSEWAKARRFLVSEGFRIDAETMTEEDGKFYLALRFVPAGETPAAYSDEELDYGPILLKKRPKAFLCWLQTEIRKEEEHLLKLRSAAPTPRTRNLLEKKEKRLAELRRIALS